MEKAATKKEVKEFCEAFLYERLAEAKASYDRLVRCECFALGGTGCSCSVKHEAVQSNGEITDIGDDVKLVSDRKKNAGKSKSVAGQRAREGLVNGSLFSGRIFRSLDEKDTAAIARLCKPKHTNESFMISKIPTALPPIKHNKVIRQPSFMEQVYDGMKNPYVLIINNVNFHLSAAPRNGAEADIYNLGTFLNTANFQSVQKYHDLTKDDMIEALESVRQDGNLVEHDGFMCIIMSHGGERGILASDSRYLEVNEVTHRFRGNNCPQLATKPKLFFIQACRGDIDDEGYLVSRGVEDPSADSQSSELPVKLPSEADFLIAYSSTKGMAAYRKFCLDKDYMNENMKTMGSWFIACLVDVFLAYSHQEDVLSMLTRVNKAMTELYTDEGHKQMACQLSMLTKKLYFPSLIDRHSRMAIND